MMRTNRAYIIDELRGGPKTIPELVDAFDPAKVKDPNHPTMSRREVYRVCNEVEEYEDTVMVARVTQKNGRFVKLLFRRKDIDELRNGAYGDIWLPMRTLEVEVPRLVQILSEPKSWKADRLKAKSRPRGSSSAITQHPIRMGKPRKPGNRSPDR